MTKSRLLLAGTAFVRVVVSPLRTVLAALRFGRKRGGRAVEACVAATLERDMRMNQPHLHFDSVPWSSSPEEIAA